MAKPLGEKSRLIRDAIKAHPHLGNTELAELINGSDARKEDRIEVKAGDVAQQKQALKKAGDAPAAARKGGSSRQPAARKAGRPAVGTTAAAPPPAQSPTPAPAAANPAELLDRVLDLAQECGSLAALKRLVDRLADLHG